MMGRAAIIYGLNPYLLTTTNPINMGYNGYNISTSIPLAYDPDELSKWDLFWHGAFSSWNNLHWGWKVGIGIGLIAIATAATILSAGAAAPALGMTFAAGAKAGAITAGIAIGAGAGIGMGANALGQIGNDSFDWGSFGMSALGGAVAGSIAAIPIGGYAGAFVFGGAGSVAGGMINGSVNSLGSVALHFGIGGVLNMGGKWVGDKVANAVNKALTNKGNEVLGGFAAQMMDLGDLAGYATMNAVQKGLTNSMQQAISHASGGFVNSFLYILLNQGLSSLVSGWY